MAVFSDSDRPKLAQRFSFWLRNPFGVVPTPKTQIGATVLLAFPTQLTQKLFGQERLASKTFRATGKSRDCQGASAKPPRVPQMFNDPTSPGEDGDSTKTSGLCPMFFFLLVLLLWCFCCWFLVLRHRISVWLKEKLSTPSVPARARKPQALLSGGSFGARRVGQKKKGLEVNPIMLTSYCGWLRNQFRTTVQKPWNDDSNVNTNKQ